MVDRICLYQRRSIFFLLIVVILISNARIITGENNQNIKLNQQFTSFLGGTYDDLTYNMVVDSEGNIILAGVTSSANYPILNAFQNNSGGGAKDSFVTKLSSDGQEIIFSTFLGGSNLDILESVGVDSEDNIIVVGSTQSQDFPVLNAYKSVLNGTIDIFLTKFDADGNVLFSTFIGGNGLENGKCPQFDLSDNIIITGHTTSSDFPISENAYQKAIAGEDDAFVLKMSTNGQSLIYSTFLGSNGTDGGNYVLLDENNRLVICGFTTSSNFPITAEAFQSVFGGGNGDGFITILDFEEGQLLYSTFIGGANRDYLWGMTFNNSSNIIIIGYTYSSNFPTTTNAIQITFNGAQDGILLIFDTNSLALNYSTLVGGSAEDDFRAVTINSKGSVIITGSTSSPDFPVSTNAFQSNKKWASDAVLTIFDPSCQSILYSTFFGGDGEDYGNGISVYSDDELVIAGSTGSSNLAVLNPIQELKAGAYDNFFGKFSITATKQGSFPTFISYLSLFVIYLVIARVVNRNKSMAI